MREKTNRTREEARRSLKENPWLQSYGDDRFIVYPHKQLQQLVTEARTKVGSYRKLAKLIGCWPDSLWRYVAGKHAIRMDYLKRTCKLLDKDFWENAVNARIRNYYVKRRDFKATVKYPGYTPQTATILGAAGDASNLLTRGYSSYCDKEIETVKHYSEIVEEEFEARYFGPRFNKGVWAVEIQNVALNWIFKDAYSLPLGRRSRKLRVPPKIFTSDQEIQYAYIAGCISTEGSIAWNPERTRNVITILSTTSKQWAGDVNNLLRGMKYHSYTCKSGLAWKTSVARANDATRLFYYVIPYMLKPSRTLKWIQMLCDERFYRKNRFASPDTVQLLRQAAARLGARNKNEIIEAISNIAYKEGYVVHAGVEDWLYRRRRVPLKVTVKCCDILGRDYFDYLPRFFAGVLWAQRLIEYEDFKSLRGVEFTQNLGELLAPPTTHQTRRDTEAAARPSWTRRSQIDQIAIRALNPRQTWRS